MARRITCLAYHILRQAWRRDYSAPLLESLLLSHRGETPFHSKHTPCVLNPSCKHDGAASAPATEKRFTHHKSFWCITFFLLLVPACVFARLRQTKSKAQEEDVLYYSLISLCSESRKKLLHNKFNQYNALAKGFSFSLSAQRMRERRETISSTIPLIKSSHFFSFVFLTPLHILEITSVALVSLSWMRWCVTSAINQNYTHLFWHCCNIWTHVKCNTHAPTAKIIS